MSEKTFSPPESFSPGAHIASMEQYRSLYAKSMADPDEFWADKAERLQWMEKWNKVCSYDFVDGKIAWFENGKLNVSQNCLDRHVEAGHGDRTAIIWEGNEPAEDKSFTYAELLAEVQRFANVLKNNGIKKGDRVCI